MKKKVLLSSILAIVMCASLIVGATLALFSDKSDVNIVVSSGNVDVEATLSDKVELSSMGVDRTQEGTFANGGEAVVDAKTGTLTLTNITPGDKATVTINVTNNSQVAIKYRAMVRAADDSALADELAFSGEGFDFGVWQSVGALETIDACKLSIELPVDVENNFQSMETKLVFSVEAVQGNAPTDNISFVRATGDARADGDTLQSVVSQAQEGATIYVGSGTYDLDSSETASDQTGWYLPIEKSNVTLIGIGNVVLTSSDVTANGSWAHQNFITIFGNNVTLDNFTIQPKMDGNKAIEICGTNFALKNINVECNQILSHEDYLKQLPAGATDWWEWFHSLITGNIYYNGDIGNAVMENVVIEKGGISTSSVTSGTVDVSNVTIDVQGWGYAPYASLPVSNNAQEVLANVDGLTIKVDSTLTTDIDNAEVITHRLGDLVSIVPQGTDIALAEGTYVFENGLDINNPVNITGAGEGTVLQMGETALSGQAYAYISANNVSVSNLTFEGTAAGYDLLKVSYRGSVAGTAIDTISLSEITFTGVADTYLNIHGATNVTVSGCTIGTQSSDEVEIPFSVASSQKVVVSDTSITAGAWGSAGVMYANNDNYWLVTDVTFENCTIASTVYTERGADTIKGITVGDEWVTVPNGDNGGVAYVKKVTNVEASGTPEENGAALVEAIVNAPANGIIDVAEGEYKVEPTTEVDGQYGEWYFAITQDNITVNGNGAVLSSDVEAQTGNWNEQNFVTIFGDNVVFENFVIQSMHPTNKAIEVVGNDVTLRNIEIVTNGAADENLGGSISINGGLLKDGVMGATLEDVTINQGWLTGYNLAEGSVINVSGVEIDFTDCYDDAYDYSTMDGYYPVSAGAAPYVKVGENGLTTRVAPNFTEKLQSYIGFAPVDTTIVLAAGEYNLTDCKDGDGYGLEIDNNIALQGEEGTVLNLSNKNGTALGANEAHLFITADGATLADLTIVGDTDAGLVKVSSRNYSPAADVIEGVTISNVIFTGTAKSYINLHGTQDAVITGCTVGTQNSYDVKLPVSIAASNNVAISNSAIAFGSWGSVGMMWGTDTNTYPFAGSVTFTDCDIAGNVYAENGDYTVNKEFFSDTTTWTAVQSESGWAYVKMSLNVAPVGTEQENGAFLQNVVLKAPAGATITVAAGVYDVPQDDTVTLNNETGFYLPIMQDNLTIIGEEGAVLTSSVETPGDSAWAMQNFITIAGDNVTLDGFTIIGKAQANKAIEVLGNKVTLKNLTLEVNEANSEAFCGSIYFSPESGTVDAALENILINQGFLTGAEGITGTIACNNVVIDYIGCAYIGQEGFAPISNKIKDLIEVGEGGLTVMVDNTFAEVADFIAAAPAGAKVEFAAGTYELNKSFNVSKNLTIVGAGAADTILVFNGCQGIVIGADLEFLTVEGVTLRGVGAIGTEVAANMGLGSFNTPYSVNDLTVTGCVIEKFDYGVYFSNSAENSKTVSATITDTIIQNCLNKAMYFETLTDSTIENCQFLNNGKVIDTTAAQFANTVCGIDINLKYGDFKNIAITDCVFTNNGLNNKLDNGGALMIKARGTGNETNEGYVAHPATLTGVTISGCEFSGNNKDIVLGEMNVDNDYPQGVDIIDCGGAVVVDYRSAEAKD